MRSRNKRKKSLDAMDEGEFFGDEDISSNKKYYHGSLKKKWILYPDEFFKSKWDIFVTL